MAARQLSRHVALPVPQNDCVATGMYVVEHRVATQVPLDMLAHLSPDICPDRLVYVAAFLPSIHRKFHLSPRDCRFRYFLAESVHSLDSGCLRKGGALYKKNFQ